MQLIGAVIGDLPQPVTGNIYCKIFVGRNVRYPLHSIDCALCGRREALLLQGNTADAQAQAQGWMQEPVHGRWICPDHRKAG
jgi:hypothetical protein